MKLYYPQTGITVLCKLFGKTRHAWYDNQWRQRETFLKDEIIIQLVLEIRNQLLRIAARKLMFMLKPKLALHGLRTGRDYLFDLLAKHKLLIRKRKITTTNSGIGCTSIGPDSTLIIESPNHPSITFRSSFLFTLKLYVE